MMIIMSAISKICEKRLIGDLKLLKKEPLEFIDALPDETNMLTWYFLLKGPAYSDYKGGYYIGTIIHSPEYPFKPPDFKMLTPSGRFTINTKICLSNSSYHSNEWSSMWTIKSILIGFLSIMLDDNEHGISHINESKEAKRSYAANSVAFNKKNYLNIIKKFDRFFNEQGDPLPEVKSESPKGTIPQPKKEAIPEPPKETTPEPKKKYFIETFDFSTLKAYKYPDQIALEYQATPWAFSLREAN
jgi:ubiquitin-conjugating enzyme E2 J2